MQGATIDFLTLKEVFLSSLTVAARARYEIIYLESQKLLITEKINNKRRMRCEQVNTLPLKMESGNGKTKKGVRRGDRALSVLRARSFDLFIFRVKLLCENAT